MTAWPGFRRLPPLPLFDEPAQSWLVLGVHRGGTLPSSKRACAARETSAPAAARARPTQALCLSCICRHSGRVLAAASDRLLSTEQC